MPDRRGKGVQKRTGAISVSQEGEKGITDLILELTDIAENIGGRAIMGIV